VGKRSSGIGARSCVSTENDSARNTRVTTSLQVYDVHEKTTLALAVIRNGGACIFCSKALPQATKAAAMAVKAAVVESDDTTSTEVPSSSSAMSTASAVGRSGEPESPQAQAALEGEPLRLWSRVSPWRT
jgi:hypothetical protein